MKKTIILLLLAAALLLASCGKTEPNETIPPVSESVSETEPATEAATETDAPALSTDTINTYLMSEIEGQYKMQGRSGTYGTSISADWSGCGIEFAAYCKNDVKIQATVIVVDEGYPLAGTYLTVYIDGVRQEERIRVTKGTKTLTIATDLEEGYHEFGVYRQSHNAHGNLNFDAITVEGVLTDRPADRDLYIEFLGDSITCGWGIYMDGDPASFPNSDATNGFAFLTAEALNADYSLVCRGSWGILHKKPGENIPDAYKYICYSRNETDLYDFETARKPDIVVFNLGTNDVSHSPSEFMAAAEAFIQDVREKNGENVPIVITWNMMNETCSAYWRRVIRNLGGEENGFYLLELPRGVGGNGQTHPNAAQHKAAADILTNFIESNLLAK